MRRYDGGPTRARISSRTCATFYQHDGVAETVHFDHIKRHYYMTHDDINPTRIVPIGPALDLAAPDERDRLSASR